MICFKSDLPCAIQVDLTWVKFNVLFLIKDAVDDGLQHLVQIHHANSLRAKQYHICQLYLIHLHVSSGFVFVPHLL